MDVRTLIAANAVLLAGYSVALWLLGSSHPGLKGVRWIRWTYVSGTAGAFLIALHGKIPELFSAIVGIGLVVLAFLLLHASMAEFVGHKQRNLRPDVVVLALTLASFLWYTYVDPSVGVRIMVFSLAVAIEASFSTVTLLRADAEEADTSLWAMAVMTGIICVLNLTRVALVVIHGAPAVFMAYNPFQAALVLVQMPISAGLAFCFVWMTTAHLRRELERLARTDFLTGLLNRRALLDEADREIARSRRKTSSLSLLVIDIDHFKQINDVHGHTTGDQALCAVAERLKAGLRSYDILARYGGEEFVMLLPETSLIDAYGIAERLRRSIEAWPTPLGRQNITVTASIGVVELQHPMEDWDSLVRRGDHALYTAKESGRNCTVVA